MITIGCSFTQCGCHDLFLAHQAGRVWRDGQKKKVFVYRFLTTGTIEEKVDWTTSFCQMGMHKLLPE